MEVSFFTMPVHPLDKPVAQTLKEDREAFLLADELGFAEAYCGEHTTDLAENIPSCIAFLASLAYQTKRIRLGTGTVNLPNSHPAAVASQVAMLDHMLEGGSISASAQADCCPTPRCSAIWTAIATPCSSGDQHGARYLGSEAPYDLKVSSGRFPRAAR